MELAGPDGDKHVLFCRERNEEREIQYVAPENLYDLNLITDIPLDGFASPDGLEWFS